MVCRYLITCASGVGEPNMRSRVSVAFASVREKYHRCIVRKRIVIIILVFGVAAGSALLIGLRGFDDSGTLRTGTLAPTTTITVSQASRSCLADGATFTTAMSAFAARNPGITVNETDLLSNSLGGPYLRGWSDDPDYVFSIVKGVLYLRSTMPGSNQVAFEGQGTCARIGL